MLYNACSVPDCKDGRIMKSLYIGRYKVRKQSASASAWPLAQGF